MSFAALRLTLPNQGLHISRETLALYRDVLVDQVMDADDVGPHLEKITPYLHNLNRMPLDGETRLSLTESLIHHYLLFIQQVDRGEESPEKHLAKLLPECNREISYAAKLILRDCAHHSKEEQARFVYWSVCALAEHLADFSRHYRPQPGALWGELHRLYLYARQRWLTDFRGNPPDRRDIESRYKQSLLLAASQPEHLSPTEQAILDGYLQRWSFRARLDHQESREFNSRYFYIDLASNLGVQTARQIQGAGNDESILVLNPLPLIEQGRHHMKQVRHGLAAEKVGLPPNLDNIDLFMTLKKGIAAWRQEGSRRFERSDCDNPTQVAVGLHTIHHYLRVPGQASNDLVPTRLLNRSKLGACLRLEDPNIAVHVGDIIIHRDPGDSKEHLGVIRWLRQSGKGRVFGLEYLVGNFQPVAVRIDDRISEAVLLSNQQSDSLITHKGYCTSNTSVRLKNFKQGLALEARAQSLVQRGQTTDQVRLKRTAV